MENYPVIIIGAGIGGLSTAAYLSRFGIKSLLLEQTAFLGGRCSNRMVNGQSYEIGAIYVGGGVFDRLRETFGVKCQSFPIRCGIKIGEKIASFPLDRKAFWEFGLCGVPLLELFRLKFKMRMLSSPETLEKYKSVGEVFDALTENRILRQFFAVMTGVSGVSPYKLPSEYFRKEPPADKYKTLNPEYVAGGNGEIASILMKLAGDNCCCMFNTQVKKILIQKNSVIGVRTADKEYSGQIVVSNAGLRPTALSLTDKEDWPDKYYRQVENTKETLKVVTVFFTFSRSFKIPKDYAVFFYPYDLNEEFRLLENGCFPDESMYALQVPSNLDDKVEGDCRATLQFYHPRGVISREQLNKQSYKVMHDGLERLFKGFSRAVIHYEVYDPARYEKDFGFQPCVFGIAPNIGSKPFDVKTPVNGLFCVGDSVFPQGPCVPQTMESGLSCAKMIIEDLKISK